MAWTPVDPYKKYCLRPSYLSCYLDLSLEQDGFSIYLSLLVNQLASVYTLFILIFILEKVNFNKYVVGIKWKAWYV